VSIAHRPFVRCTYRLQALAVLKLGARFRRR
jgi:hypothetical protein